MSKKRIWQIVLAAVAVLLGITAVLLLWPQKSHPPEGPARPPSGEVLPGKGFQPDLPDVSGPLQAAIKKNSDVVGWLSVPNTEIDEAVVQTTDNNFYLRRDVEKKYAFEGCYYLDYESVLFDDGADLAQNSIIYGHNLGNPKGLTDDPNSVKFAQLFRFLDEETARNTPYVFLTTPAKTHVFEVFAVFYAEARTAPVPYHYAEYLPEQLIELTKDAQARSEFSYSVQVQPTDQLLTLSTCTYKYGTYTQNPNQRFVLMARLVQDGETMHETAKVKKNPSPKQPTFT